MKIKIECVKNLSSAEAEEILKINHDNLYVNGGQLHYAGILNHKFAVLAKIDGKVVGYTLLYPGFLVKKDLYVMQVAVDKNYQHLGIGSKMYKYAYEHSKEYSVLTANVNENNNISQNFHLKMGFIKYGNNNLGIIYVNPVTENVKKCFDDARPKCFYIKSNKESFEK